MYRIMIADDEMLVCRGLEHLVQTMFPEVSVISSVYNGADLLDQAAREKPDMIIADINMPGISGLDAIELLNMRSCGAKIIINTAYSDFVYLQRALKLGACGYLLKPTDVQQLRECMEKVLKMLDQERQERQDRAEISLRTKKEQRIIEAEVISSVLLGEPDEESRSMLAQMRNCSMDGGVMICVQGKKYAVRLETWEQNWREFLENYCICMTRIYRNNMFLLMFPDRHVNEENYRDWLENLLLELKEKNPGEGDLWCAGIGCWKQDFSRMSESFWECQAALRERGSAENWYSFYERKTVSQEEAKTAKVLGELRELWIQGEREAFREKTEKMLEQYEKGQGLDPYIRFQIMQLVEDCRRDRDVVNQYPAEDILRRNNIKKKIDQSETGRELADQIMELLEEETGKISQDNRMVHVEKAIRYIEENYMRDISLEETAQKICITSVYLSRLFKNLLHINFIELLTDVRISHAIRLIQNSDDTIREIGEKVGYQSQTYFYKVFKKNTGMTVGEVKAIFSSSGKMEDR